MNTPNTVKERKTRNALAMLAMLAGGLLSIAAEPATANAQQPAHLAVLGPASLPIGFVQYCRDVPADCQRDTIKDPRDIVLDQKSWTIMARINRDVNTAIEPVSDMEHWGVEEYWSIPTDGKGDCEDYVLLKRQKLIQAGFPRESLLITVVRDQKNEGHAVLIVKTDRGDFVLDNQAEKIVLWHETGYRFIKRQSQTNTSQWVMIGPSNAQPLAVAAAPR